MALNTDLDWVREAYAVPETGEGVGRRSASPRIAGSCLPRDIALANEWAESRPARAPELTALQREFISASEAEDIRQATAKAEG